MYSVSKCQVYPLGHVGEEIPFNTVLTFVKQGHYREIQYFEQSPNETVARIWGTAGQVLS